jgi:hydrogenase maturation protein HypF
MDRSQASEEQAARLITVRGRVQGVGFRPFLFRLAEAFHIQGTAQNNMDGIRMEAEGTEENLERLIRSIREDAPRLSRVEDVSVVPVKQQGYMDFRIIESSREGASSLVIPVDSAVCPQCLAEMSDPENRRYRYPFITCTDCGPRYTIIRELPYDRPYTSMSGFPMCVRCTEEYNNVRDRRHHAQPIACPDCGPALSLYRADRSNLDTGGASSAAGGSTESAGSANVKAPSLALGDAAVLRTIELLQQGAIVAIKGLGGYHLACDAANEEAVSRLRQRKRRPTRPLAVMAAGMADCLQACFLSGGEQELLASPEAPIVIARKRGSGLLAESVAPGMTTIGLMLPYTPLHHLLMEGLPYLVMTSANPSGKPILYKDEEALPYLSGIADYILAHNREIFHPLDDSVVQLVDSRLDILRRSRGYAPDPAEAAMPVHNLAAYGGQQKNTFVLGRHRQLFAGPHIGDMEGMEVQEHWQQEYAHLTRWLGVQPHRLAVDLHPAYETGRIARESGVETVFVQHHHAHLVSCAADNGLPAGEDVYGIILDGTGYGTDGALWGFEVLSGSAQRYNRLGHLRYTPLPGGEAAIRQPWRNAAAMLMHLLPGEGEMLAAELFSCKRQELGTIARMVQQGLNSPLAGTCGRLFDAVSAILGLVMVSGYDGEAAIRLSELAAFTEESPDSIPVYPYEIRYDGSCMELDMKKALRGIVMDRLGGMPAEVLAVRFHETLARAAAELLGECRRQELVSTSTNKVMLSGGSFHNRYMAVRVAELLSRQGLEPYLHRRFPAGDGGLALGQLVVAAYGAQG